MSKYIIDIPDNVKKIVYFHLGNANAVWTTSNDLDDLEQLNSDYINEHFGELQDTAYQRGLDDAWEAARKIADMWTRMDNNELLAIFGITERIGHSTINSLFGKQTANEAVLNLEAYEEKQKADDKIEVGDEVTHKSDSITWTAVVTKNEDGLLTLMGRSGAIADNYNEESFVKTGRHFDIQSILEDMKHD